MGKLTFIHSRTFGYAALTLAVLALEVVFAWRISLVYGELLQGQGSVWEINVLKGAVFLAVAVFGFVLATHRHYGVTAIRTRLQSGAWSGALGVFMAVLVIVAHDWGAAIYTVFGSGQAPTPGRVAVTVGMCGLVLVPFLIGRMALAMAESLQDEAQAAFAQRKQRVEQEQALTALTRGDKGAAPALPAARSPRSGRVPPAAPARSLWKQPGAAPAGEEEAGEADPFADGHPGS